MGTFLTIVKYLPAIIEAVKAAEAAISLPGQGKAKLDFVLGIFEDTVGDVGALIPAVTKIIARIVALFNGTGAFKTGA